jgi:copper transport protein
MAERSCGNRRRSKRAAAIALCLVLLPVTAHAHATLLRSTPAANSRLAELPETIRLVFSEQVVPDLSQITLVRPDGSVVQLHVANDPHDVHTLIGRGTGELANGRYRVSWRVLSSDGHPVGGGFGFSIARAGDTARSGAAAPLKGAAIVGTPPSRSLPTPQPKQVPVLASLSRGLGIGALMMGLGLLFFAVTSRQNRHLVPRALIVRAITIGAVLLLVHMIAWLELVSPIGTLDVDFIAAVFSSTIGQVELLRTALALLTLWAIVLARRDRLTLALGAACLVVSGAIGHPAAIDPLWAIPAKALHMVAASLWLGGLIWLVWLSRCDDAACRAEARRVSAVALASVIAIFLSGSLQMVLFLNAPADLISSDYGRLVLAKMLGLAILIGFGRHNRFNLLPQLDAVGGTTRLSTSLKQEIVVVAVVILIGGFLAYVPTPSVPGLAMSATSGLSQ